MKKMILLAAVLVMGCAFVHAAPAEKKAAPAAAPLVNAKWVGGWCPNGFAAKNTAKDEKSFTIQITKVSPKRGATNIQQWVYTSAAFKKGVKYRLSFTIKSSANGTAFAIVCLNGAPYSQFSPTKNFKFVKDVPQKVTIDFSIKDPKKGMVCRAPNFALGDMPAGTVINVTDFVCTEVK